MPTALESRVNRLESADDRIILIQDCEACGRMVLFSEANAWGSYQPPCTRGLSHTPIRPPANGPILQFRTEGLTCPPPPKPAD